MGSNAGGAMTTGFMNTAIGGEALLAHTTGEKNVALGFRALKTDQEGDQNTALGYQALEAHNATAGHGQNTAVGANAMAVSGDPRYCVAVGAEALAAGNCSTDGHVAIGYEALNDLVSGAENTAVGYQAAKDMTTGDDNTFIGYQSGLGTDASGTPDGNTAVGRASLLALTTGATNTVVGKNAGDAITSGNGNVFIGSNTGDTNQTGCCNTAVGSTADVGATDAENQNVFGYNVQGPDEDNSVTLGNNSVTKIHMSQDKDAEMFANGTINTSDRRWKKNIEDSDLGLSFINSVRPVKYNFKSDKDGSKSRYGVVAQEVIEVLEAIDKEDFSGIRTNDPERLGADYIQFVAPLIKAVQELSTKVEAQQKEIEELKK